MKSWYWEKSWVFGNWIETCVELIFVQVITVELILHWIADNEESKEIVEGN